jgi:ABC-2 type transport system ATP-binding protein
VEKVCTPVAILKKGNLLLSGPVDDELRSEDLIEVQARDMQMLQNVVKEMPGVNNIQMVNGCLQLYCDAHVEPYQVNEYCISRGVVLSLLSLKKKSLETKFMELTG